MRQGVFKDERAHKQRGLERQGGTQWLCMTHSTDTSCSDTCTLTPIDHNVQVFVHDSPFADTLSF